MKKLLVFLTALMACCVPAAASGGQGEAAHAVSSVPLWMCIPFAGLLLCIAVLPLVKAHWWEEHQPIVVAFWSILFLIPYAMMGGAGGAVELTLECIVNDYLTFIVLLFGLFCASFCLECGRHFQTSRLGWRLV